MTLSADALKYLVETGKALAEPKTVKLPGGRTMTMFGDSIDIAETDPVPIMDTLETLQDLAIWLERYATEAGIDDRFPPVVMVGAFSVQAFVRRETHHDKATAHVPIPFSAAFDAIRVLCTDGMKQKEFVRALRGPWANSIDGQWLPVFRRMDFQRLQTSTRAVGPKGESLGRSVEMQAQSAEGDIPEQLTFRLPVYQLPELSQQELRVALEVDVDAEKIRGFRIGDDFELALTDARREIVLWLRDYVGEHITVLTGSV